MRRTHRRIRALELGLAALGLFAWIGQAQAQTQTPPSAPSDQTPPIGVTPLPTTPPPTGLQAPLPAPTRPLPKPDRPQQVSPPLGQASGTAPSAPIDINQAVAIALGNSRELALATETLLQAQGRTSETRAAFNPTLSAGFTYTRLNKGQSATFGNQSITLVNPDQPQFTVQTTLPIDIVGELRAAQQQAQFQEVAARIDINRTRNQIVLNVKDAFYNVLRAQSLVTVAQETLQDDLDRLADAQKRFTAGTAARFDVIRAQTDVANAEQQLITAKSNVNLSIANLNNTLGIAIDTPLQVTDRNAVQNPPGVALPAEIPGTTNPTPALPNQPAPPQPNAPQEGQDAGVMPGANRLNPQPSALSPIRQGQGAGGMTGTDLLGSNSLDLGTEYNAAVQEALQTRPEILEADAQVAAARKGIYLARRSELPTLGLALNGTYAPNTAGFSPQTTSGNLVVSISAPLFDAGVARARVIQARAVVAQAETNRRQATDAVNLDVRSAYLTLLQARDRVVVANQALAEAQESYRLSRVRYNNGVSTLVEVSDAQAALTQAENNQVNALYDYNNARSSLDKAIGRYSYVSNGPGYATPPPAKTVGRTRADITTGGQR